MSQRHDCPIPRFAGYIILPDYLNYEQVILWRKTAAETLPLFEGDPSKPGDLHIRPGVVFEQFKAARLPALLLCVEEWHLQNVPAHPTPATFPATPLKSAEKLYTWVRDLVDNLFAAEDEDENPKND